ncbi:hypothetical protein EJD97_013890 [Solanum chilense]|uniref:Uncharacterized protein n=1 Tax=Solanum chilense TaxID=4083 RepID=A0A6N2AIG7_SOLCI|nr:hypothetical protein EJD97_013890 [Solanum chilense]
MVGQHRTLHAIIALGQNTQSDDVGCGMPLSLLGTIHGWTTSGVACHHNPWKTYTIRLRQAWMPSSPLGSKHGHKASGLAYNNAIRKHTQSEGVDHNMPSLALENTHNRTTLHVSCHHLP